MCRSFEQIDIKQKNGTNSEQQESSAHEIQHEQQSIAVSKSQLEKHFLILIILIVFFKFILLVFKK